MGWWLLNIRISLYIYLKQWTPHLKLFIKSISKHMIFSLFYIIGITFTNILISWLDDTKLHQFTWKVWSSAPSILLFRCCQTTYTVLSSLDYYLFMLSPCVFFSLPIRWIMRFGGKCLLNFLLSNQFRMFFFGFNIHTIFKIYTTKSLLN